MNDNVLVNGSCAEKISSNNKKKYNIKDKIIIKDVLFINGCHTDKVPHPFRYFYLNFEPLIIRYYRVIIFFRCPWTENVGKAIELAKNLNKIVLFDIDDLVFDKKYTNTIPYVKTLSKNEKDIYDDGVERIGKTLTLCDGAITTTKALAKELKHYVSNVFINHNVASEEMWKLSQKALINRDNKKRDNKIIIGYFSGSITHDSDINMIKPALIKILREYKNVELLLLGKLSYPDFLNEFSSQIKKKRFINWKNLPKIISRVDINISPIENSIFNEAKSENTVNYIFKLDKFLK